MTATTMDSPHLTKTNRKISMRQHLKEMKQMVKGSNWTGLVKHKSDATRPTPSSPTKATVAELPAGYDFLTNGFPSTNRKPAREKTRRKQEKQKAARLDNQRNSLYTLKIEEPTLSDLRMSFEQGDDRWSVADPAIIQRESEKELAVGRDPAEKEVVDVDPLHVLGNANDHIGSESSIAPSRVDSTRPENDKLPELRKPTRKWEVKTDNLARPVSRATGNTEALKVSKTIESINKNRYSLLVPKEREHAAAAVISYHNIGRRGSEMAPEVVSPLVDETPGLSSRGSDNTKALTMAPPPLAPKSNTPIAESMFSPSTFSFNINNNLRRAAPGTSSTLNPNSDRHSVGDMNKLLVENRESRSPTRKQPPPLNIKRSFSVGATSPTKKAETQPNTPTYRPRRVSGAKMADRMAWLRELEDKSSGKGSPGRAAMYKNLQGGVADKLARFESSNKDTGLNLKRTTSVSSRMSTFNDAYGIENATGKRLSKASTMDEEFRRKLEEVAEKAKKRIDKEGDQEALIAQVNRDAELALMEEKRRSLKMESAGPFKYAFDDKAGRKTDLVPDPEKIRAVAATTPPTEVVDLQSFTPTRKGSTKMPKFNVKDPNAVAASANTLVEEKIAAPVFNLKDPNAVAASANPPISVESQVDDGEYDPFNVMTYPVSKAMPSIHKLTHGKTNGEQSATETSDSQAAEEETEEAVVPEAAAADVPQVLEEPKKEVDDEPTTHIPALEPVELVQPQASEKPKIETTAEQEPRLDEDGTVPATETTGITTTEVKDEMKAEVAAEPATAIDEKVASQIIQPNTNEVNEETEVDVTTQPTPKIEAKPSPLIEPISLEPPLVGINTKPETSTEPATTQALSTEESAATKEDTKPETCSELATAKPTDAPAVEETAAKIPVINTTPPTPPAKKETPVPKYLALRERAQKAAEMPSKPAPAPAPVATSQTFSRLFGPPMTSGMGRSRSPSPVKKAEVPAPTSPKAEGISLEKEGDAKKEVEVEKDVMAKEEVLMKSTPATSAVEIPAPKEIPETPSESTVPTVIPNHDVPANERKISGDTDPSIENTVPTESEKTMPIAEEAPIQTETSTGEVTPFLTSTVSLIKDISIQKTSV